MSWKEKTEKILLGSAFVLIACIVNVGLHHSRIYEFIEEITFDHWIRASPAAPSRDVQIIAIDDASYKGPFKSKSPLEHLKVGELIRAALDGGATVVGVDIDTEDWSQSDWKSIGHPLTNVVWACREPCRSSPPQGGVFGSARIAPANVHNPARRSETGIFRTHPPFDGKTFSEQIARILRTGATANCDAGNVPSGGEPFNQTRSEPESAYVRFVTRGGKPDAPTPSPEPNFITWPAKNVLEASATAGAKKNTLLCNAAVLIGGTADELRDFYETPFGLESGVGFQADLVSSLLNDPIEPMAEWSVFLTDFVIGMALVVLGLFVKKWTTAFLTLILSFIFLLAASFTLFRLSGVFLGGITVFIGVLLHKWFEFYQEYGQLTRSTQRSG